MSKTNAERMDDEAEEWFYDLGAMARRIKASEARGATLRKRQYVVVSFVLFAFMLLAWRSEVNASRIDRNTDRITETQIRSCESGREILRNFNDFQDEQIRIERSNPFIDDTIRNQRIAAYQRAKIDPLPVCTNMRGR
jgi:hypothetical protein